ncbi:MAG: hypothetical protein OEV08_05085 [Nitrospira sp.]|nr:hypothetical protein [Nitrospira sp.]
MNFLDWFRSQVLQLETKQFLISYDMPDGRYSLTIQAASLDDAKRHVAAIKRSVVIDGECF